MHKFYGVSVTSLVLLTNVIMKNQVVLSSEEIPYHMQVILNKTCTEIKEDLFPVMQLKHGDEVHNSSFELTENSDTLHEHLGYSFSMTCTAKYPIDWVVNYFNNGYQNGKAFGLHLQISRSFTSFHDLSTNIFMITSKMRYKNAHGFKNFSFSCRSIHRPNCLQTTLYTTKLINRGMGESNGIELNIVNPLNSHIDLIHDVPWGKSSLSSEKHPSMPCDYKIYFQNFGLNRFGLRCENKDGTPGTVKVIHQCTNAISCMAFHHQYLPNFIDDSCVESLAVLDGQNASSCATCQERTFRLSQGFLACVSEEPHPTPNPHHYEDKLLFFFSSVPQEESQELSNKLYFDMNHVDPSEMISLGKIPSKVSPGDQITIVCNTSSYYFASGTRLAIKHKGLNELYFLKATLVTPGSSGSENYPASVYEATIPITTDAIERIYCFAPAWNSFSWVNKSHDIHVQDKSPSHILIAVSVTLLFTTIFCGILFALCWMKLLRRKLSNFGKLLTPQEVEDFRRKPEKSDSDRAVNDYEYVNAGLAANYNASLEVKREQLLLDETVVLGKGHFGKVLKGVFKDVKTGQKIDVAVKTLKTKTDVGALKSLLSELKIMASIAKHPNVVNLVAACTKRMEKGEVYVCVEFCANGNMQNYLRTHREKFKNQLQRDILIVDTPFSFRKSVSDDVITTLDIIKWSWEVAKGMEFLSSNKIIHGDLATRNILLNSENVAKVSDFGLSRQLVDYYYVKEESGPMPWKWMSIESLRDMKFSVQSDIWSCGVLIWELFTLADVPYYGCSWSAEFVQALVSGHRLGKPQYATTEMYDLMRACWKEDPHERPSFFAIKMFFEDILTQCTYQDYMQLDVLPIQEHNQNSSRSPLLGLMTPTVDIISDCEVEDDVFEQ